MKNYQLTALFAVTSAAVTAFFAAVAYCSTSYASAITAFLIVICMACVTAMLVAEAIMEYQSERRIARWRAARRITRWPVGARRAK